MREEAILISSLAAEALLYERTGLSAGGILAPALVAMHLHEPTFLLYVLALTALTYVAALLLSLLVPLYGRRALYAFVLISALLRLLASKVDASPTLDSTLLTSIAPGILAYQMRTQGALITLSAMTSTALFAYCAGVLI